MFVCVWHAHGVPQAAGHQGILSLGDLLHGQRFWLKLTGVKVLHGAQGYLGGIKEHLSICRPQSADVLRMFQRRACCCSVLFRYMSACPAPAAGGWGSAGRSCIICSHLFPHMLTSSVTCA
jgi:hypothetical protein